MQAAADRLRHLDMELGLGKENSVQDSLPRFGPDLLVRRGTYYRNRHC